MKLILYVSMCTPGSKWLIPSFIGFHLAQSIRRAGLPRMADRRRRRLDRGLARVHVPSGRMFTPHHDPRKDGLFRVYVGDDVYIRLAWGIVGAGSRNCVGDK